MAEILQFPDHLRKKPEKGNEARLAMEPGKFYDLQPPAEIGGELYDKVQCEYQVPNSPNEYSVKGIPRGGMEVKAFILRFKPDRGVTVTESKEQGFDSKAE